MTHLEKAQELKAKGSPLTIDQLIAFLEKKEAKASKNFNRSMKKFDARAEAAEIIKTLPVRHASDMYAEAARNQRPSSMR